jgi:hypothetical protein
MEAEREHSPNISFKGTPHDLTSFHCTMPLKGSMASQRSHQDTGTKPLTHWPLVDAYPNDSTIYDTRIIIALRVLSGLMR